MITVSIWRFLSHYHYFASREVSHPDKVNSTSQVVVVHLPAHNVEDAHLNAFCTTHNMAKAGTQATPWLRTNLQPFWFSKFNFPFSICLSSIAARGDNEDFWPNAATEQANSVTKNINLFIIKILCQYSKYIYSYRNEQINTYNVEKAPIKCIIQIFSPYPNPVIPMFSRCSVVVQ